MAKKGTTPRKSARQSRTTPPTGLSSWWIVVIAVLAFLLVWSLASNVTRVDVGTVQNDLANLQAQLTAQAAVTEAPTATEAPAATPISSVKWTSAMMLPQSAIDKCSATTVEYEDYNSHILYNCAEVRAFVAAQQASAQPTSCELDKIGTWSETSSTSPYRIEVGGHGIQAMDFYPTKDVKSISYIVSAIAPTETPAIWFGYGSDWEGQLSECGNFDFVADATNYAKARLDSGHSGLVVDLRGGQFKVVANVANISQEDINALLALHMAAMDPTK